MTKKEVTIDELARMVQNGFSEMSESFSSLLMSEISGVRTELKEEISAVRSELKGEIGSLRQEFQSFRSETRGNFELVQDELGESKLAISRIEKRTLVDDNVLSGEVILLKNRMVKVEKELFHREKVKNA